MKRLLNPEMGTGERRGSYLLKKLFAALNVFLVVSANGALAAVTEFGNPECKEWVDTNNPGNKVWLLGYLSGLNLAYAKANNDPLDHMENVEQAFTWMNAYCKRNPKKTVGEAAQIFYMELKKKGN